MKKVTILLKLNVPNIHTHAMELLKVQGVRSNQWLEIAYIMFKSVDEELSSAYDDSLYSSSVRSNKNSKFHPEVYSTGHVSIISLDMQHFGVPKSDNPIHARLLRSGDLAFQGRDK